MSQPASREHVLLNSSRQATYGVLSALFCSRPFEGRPIHATFSEGSGRVPTVMPRALLASKQVVNLLILLATRSGTNPAG